MMMGFVADATVGADELDPIALDRSTVPIGRRRRQ